MITDSQTNFVYFAKSLAEKYKPEWERVTSILDKHNVKHGLLNGTKGIWCRDFMPIQTGNHEYIGFRYEPLYHDKPEDITAQSDPKLVCKANGITAKFSDINLDGGNVVRWTDRVMISERVFDENNEIPQVKLISQLEKLLDAEIIIVPQIKSDMSGHADGMVRFFDRNTILVNELEREYRYWRIAMEKVISRYNLNIIEVPWFEPKLRKSDSAIGCYINYLDVGNLIIIPRFEVEGNYDEQVLILFKHIFKSKTIETVEINRIASEGGVLNCITWNILKS